MSQSSTTILGPYDDFTSSEKIILSASVPPRVRKVLFEQMLPRRGAIDKVVCRLLNTIYEYVEGNLELQTLDENAREFAVNAMLNAFPEFLQHLPYQSFIPDTQPAEPTIEILPEELNEIL